MVPLTQPFAVTALGVRWLHVLAATVAVGGSVLTWFRFRLATADADDGDAARGARHLARGYEWLFWAAVGVLVMTGVGTLGTFAPSLPRGDWRTTLDVKLGVLSLVLVGSAVRTRLLVAYHSRLSVRRLEWMYGATAVALVVLLTLAEVLAHG